ncbi:MAG: hypothetical protein AAF267_23735, partial [Deinococcota bacterium]
TIKVKYQGKAVLAGYLLDLEVADNKELLVNVSLLESLPKACPHCGSEALRVEHMVNDGNHFYNIECQACHKQGKIGQLKTEKAPGVNLYYDQRLEWHLPPQANTHYNVISDQATEPFWQRHTTCVQQLGFGKNNKDEFKQFVESLLGRQLEDIHTLTPDNEIFLAAVFQNCEQAKSLLNLFRQARAAQLPVNTPTSDDMRSSGAVSREGSKLSRTTNASATSENALDLLTELKDRLDDAGVPRSRCSEIVNRLTGKASLNELTELEISKVIEAANSVFVGACTWKDYGITFNKMGIDPIAEGEALNIHEVPSE